MFIFSHTLWGQCGDIRQLKCLPGRRAAAVAITVASLQKRSPESEPSHCRCSLHWLHLVPHSTSWTRSFSSSTVTHWFSNFFFFLMLHLPLPPSLITLNIFGALDSCCFPLISAELEIQLTHSRNCIQCLIAMIKLFRPEKKCNRTQKKENNEMPLSYAISISMN